MKKFPTLNLPSLVVLLCLIAGGLISQQKAGTSLAPDQLRILQGPSAPVVKRYVQRIPRLTAVLPTITLPPQFNPEMNTTTGAEMLSVVRNGLTLSSGLDYTYAVETKTVTFLPNASPQIDDDVVLIVWQ